MSEDPRVQAVLDRLTLCADMPLAEQVAVFTGIQQQLAAVLAESAG